MNRIAFVLFVLIGCSSAPQDRPVGLRERNADSEESTRSDDVATAPAPTEPAPNTAPDTMQPAPADPTTPDAGTPVCDLGDGLYCGGNHVPGAANELYQCSGGIPTLVETCATECAKFPDGLNDHCSCAFGNGLYCGGNGVNGDANTLYRCSNGAVNVETTCANGCDKRPNGINDACL